MPTHLLVTTSYEILQNRYIITHLFYFFLSIWSGWGASLLHIQSNLVLWRNKHPFSAPGSGCHDFQAFVNKATYTWVIVYFKTKRLLLSARIGYMTINTTHIHDRYKDLLRFSVSCFFQTLYTLEP